MVDDGVGPARGFLVTFTDVTELSEAYAKLQRALGDLEASKDQIEQQNQELKKRAYIDPLSGCFNRRAFFERVEPLFQSVAAGGAGERLVCIMCDIDHFKSFNDKYGHAVGDLVIQQVAAAIARSLRTDDILCRYGGEEFCMILPSPEGDGTEVGERIRARIEKEAGSGVRTIDGLRVTSSVGVALFESGDPLHSVSELIEQADQALYSAKKTGRNKVVRAPVVETLDA
jgi:diguanylate cyclase (GGDEF)-like protein